MLIEFDKADVRTANQHIGERLKSIRKQKGLQQTELANRVGVKSPQIHKFESGDQRISSGMLFAIANVMGVEMNEFFRTIQIANEIS